MEKKKLKLSISGTSKKTISSIEKAKSQSKNTVLIEKKSSRFGNKKTASRLTRPNDKFKSKTSFVAKKPLFAKSIASGASDFEKRKLAEQRATRRLKGETFQREIKGKPEAIRRELKLTVSRALSEDDIETRTRRLASLKRANRKENSLRKNEAKLNKIEDTTDKSLEDIPHQESIIAGNTNRTIFSE